MGTLALEGGLELAETTAPIIEEEAKDVLLPEAEQLGKKAVSGVGNTLRRRFNMFFSKQPIKKVEEKIGEKAEKIVEKKAEGGIKKYAKKGLSSLFFGGILPAVGFSVGGKLLPDEKKVRHTHTHIHKSMKHKRNMG